MKIESRSSVKQARARGVNRSAITRSAGLVYLRARINGLNRASGVGLASLVEFAPAVSPAGRISSGRGGGRFMRSAARQRYRSHDASSN